MLTVRQTRFDYPGAASKEQTYGWVDIRTDVTFDGQIGIMSEPYTTAEAALAVGLPGIEHLATIAYAKIDRA
jgi:hypothetical protein